MTRTISPVGPNRTGTTSCVARYAFQELRRCKVERIYRPGVSWGLCPSTKEGCTSDDDVILIFPPFGPMSTILCVNSPVHIRYRIPSAMGHKLSNIGQASGLGGSTYREKRPRRTDRQPWIFPGCCPRSHLTPLYLQAFSSTPCSGAHLSQTGVDAGNVFLGL